jgi:hypothetical protein
LALSPFGAAWPTILEPLTFAHEHVVMMRDGGLEVRNELGARVANITIENTTVEHVNRIVRGDHVTQTYYICLLGAGQTSRRKPVAYVTGMLGFDL